MNGMFPVLFEQLALSDAFRCLLAGIREGEGEQCAHGLWGASSALTVAGLISETGRPALVILPDTDRAEEAAVNLRAFSRSRVSVFPRWEILPCDTAEPHADIVAERLSVLDMLVRGGEEASIVAAPVHALLPLTIPGDLLERRSYQVKTGEHVDRDQLLARLVSLGYERCGQVRECGQFSVRGGIIDVFPVHETGPVRIELMGSRVESVRAFDPMTQRSRCGLDGMRVVPVSESDGVEEGARGTFFEYLRPDTLVVMEDPAAVVARVAEFEQQVSELRGRGLNPLFRAALGLSELLEQCRRFQFVTVSSIRDVLPDAKPRRTHRFETQSLEDIPGRLDGLMERVAGWREKNWHTIVACNNEGERDRLVELLRERGVHEGDMLQVVVEHVEKGFVFPGARLVLVSDQDVFGRYRLKRYSRKQPWRGVQVTSLSELTPGDPVVHVQHGIGSYLGIEKLEVDEAARDFMALEYLGGDKLYVPVEQMRLVHRYVGPEEAPPRFDRLGGGMWQAWEMRLECG